MSHFRKSIPPLIVDSDAEFLASLTSDPKAAQLAPVMAKGGKEAQLLLADPSKSFGGVFVDPGIPSPGAVSVIRFTHLHRPTTPVYVIVKDACPFSEKEIKLLGVEKIIQKPVKYSDLLSLIGPSVATFDEASAINAAKQNNDALNTEVSSEDENFKPIRSENFLSGNKSFFDIYVKLGSGRFLKLIQAGDSFTIDRILGYIQKGVTHFYLRKEAQEHYIAYCDKLTSAILKSDKISMNIKASQTMNEGDEILKFFKDNGVSETSLHYAANFTKNVGQLVEQLKPGQQPLLKGFMNDVSSYEHGVACTMVASMLINSLHMTSNDPIETVGISCMLHDIGLYQLNLVQFDEDESQMNDEQKALYYSHPIVGAEALQKIGRLKPVVIQAVAQHHERRNKKGFPEKIGSGSISLVADVVGISDEFVKILTRIKKDPKYNFKEAIEQNIVACFTTSLVHEFKKVFLFTQETQGSVVKVKSLKVA